MIRDEFNNIEVTNDKQLLRVEYGKTQKFEFSSQKDNTTPEGELNEKYLGKTIKSVTEVNVDYVNKVQTHATQTVVSSSTTATSAASAAAATAVAASTVAVVAIATVTGISVALHDYHCELTSLLITSDSITYQMSIIDSKREDGEDYQTYSDDVKPNGRFNDIAGGPNADYEEDDPEAIFDETRPFVLKVSNDSFVLEHYLDYGPSNYGYISGLTLGDTYNITLSENRYGGEVLYNEYFTTYKNSFVTDFYLSGASNFREGTFEVYLDYLDELEDLSDFTLTLTDQEQPEKQFIIPIEPVLGYQNASVYSQDQSSADFDFESVYDYVFSYKKGDNVYEFSRGSITFYNASSMDSIVYGVNWDKTANFIDKTFNVQLNYIDDYDYFDNFSLELLDAEYPEEVYETFALQKTTDVQTVTIGNQSSINLRREYKYIFRYENQGVEDIIDSGVVTFTDNSGGKKEFRSITIDPKPNFSDNTFNVQLDYDDDFNEFESFTLILSAPDINDIYLYLDKTTEEQAVSAKEDWYEVDFTQEYTYTLRYWDGEVGDYVDAVTDQSLTFDLTDAVSNFNAFIFDETGDFANETFVLRIDYVDQLKVFTDFVFELSAIGKAYSKTIHLLNTTAPQTQQLNESGASSDYTADMTEDTFVYSFKYYDEREGAYIDVVTQEEFNFMPSELHSFNGIETNYDFTPEEGGQSYTLPIRFDYDKSYNIYTSFDVVISKDQAEFATLRFEGETYTDEWLYAVLVPDGANIDDIIGAEDVSINVVAWTNMEDYQMVQPSIEVYYEDNVNFTLGEKKELVGGSLEEEYINMSSTLYMTLVMSGNPDDFEYQLLLESYWGNVYTYSLELGTMGYAYVDIGSPDSGPSITEENFESEFTDYPMKVTIKYRVHLDGDTWSDYQTKVLYDSYQFHLSV